jgi:hypothetical protein
LVDFPARRQRRERRNLAVGEARGFRGIVKAVVSLRTFCRATEGGADPASLNPGWMVLKAAPTGL